MEKCTILTSPSDGFARFYPNLLPRGTARRYVTWISAPHMGGRMNRPSAHPRSRYTKATLWARGWMASIKLPTTHVQGIPRQLPILGRDLTHTYTRSSHVRRSVLQFNWFRVSCNCAWAPRTPRTGNKQGNGEKHWIQEGNFGWVHCAFLCIVGSPVLEHTILGGVRNHQKLFPIRKNVVFSGTHPPKLYKV